MATYTWEYGAEGTGLHFTIEYDIATQQFTVQSIEGTFDLNALWWGDDVSDGQSPTLSGKDSSLNMNGDNTVWDDNGQATAEKIDWDGVQKLSSTGLGKEGESKSTFISPSDGEVSFDAGADFQAFFSGLDDGADFTLGVRATSVNGGGSIKFADTDPDYTPDTPPPPPQDDFPDEDPDAQPNAISHITLYFDNETVADGAGDIHGRQPDGVFTVKIDAVPGGADQNLDDWIQDVLTYLSEEGVDVGGNTIKIDSDSDLLGVAIKFGADETYYAYGSNNTNGTDPDTPPPGPYTDGQYDDGGNPNDPSLNPLVQFVDGSVDYQVLVDQGYIA